MALIEAAKPAPAPWICEWCNRTIEREPDLWSCDDGPKGFPVCSRRCRDGHEKYVGFKRQRKVKARG